MMKTPEEVKELKRNWVNDPIWDIEDTDGFEEWREELTAFRMAKEREWKAKRDAMPINRAKNLADANDPAAIAFALIVIAEELIKLNKTIEEFVDRH